MIRTLEKEKEIRTSRKKGRSPLRPPRSASEYALLALLLEGESHGYELTRRFAEGTALRMVCRLEMSMVYGLLKKLEKDGVLTGRDVPIGESKTRRLVSLTPDGRSEVESWLAAPVEHTREMRLDFLVKLYFLVQRQPASAGQLLDEQLAQHTQLLNRQKEQQHLLLSGADAENSPSENPFQWWVLEFRVAQAQAVVNWLKAYKQSLRL